MTNPTIRFDDRKLGLVIDNMPALEGSEKQIAWAETIRHEMFQTQISVRFDAMRAKADPARVAAFPSFLTEKMGPLFAVASAKFWIDSRNKDLQALAAIKGV